MDELTQNRLKRATILKILLRTNGVNVIDEPTGVGDTIKEDVNGLYQISKGADGGINLKPNELVFERGITTKLVYNDESLFSLRKIDETFYIFSKEEIPISEVKFSKRPKHYGV